VAEGLGGGVKLGRGATIEGSAFPGAVFTLTVAQRAPLGVGDGSA